MHSPALKMVDGHNTLFLASYNLRYEHVNHCLKVRLDSLIFLHRFDYRRT